MRTARGVTVAAVPASLVALPAVTERTSARRLLFGWGLRSGGSLVY